jgi:integrase
VRGVKVRANDPRATKPRREPRVLSFEEMHEFAAVACSHEAMIRAFSDCGLRLGEVLGLERADFDGEAFHVRGSAHRGVFTPGDLPTKKHVRTIPLPPSTAELVRAIPVRIDTPLMFLVRPRSCRPGSARRYHAGFGRRGRPQTRARPG